METNTKTLSIKGEELKESPFPIFQNKLGYDESDKMNSAHFMLKLIWDNFGSPVTEVLKNAFDFVIVANLIPPHLRLCH
nr:217_t:CDS:2 [Entrophospora candida]